MEFVCKNIGDRVLAELNAAFETRLATAFFNPENSIQEALLSLKQLKVVYSDEYLVTNPYKLEQLVHAHLRSVPPWDPTGKLHAKVLLITREDRTVWGLLGSANMTYKGMFHNQEACVVYDSRSGDNDLIHQSLAWFDELWSRASTPDLEQAKAIFNTQSQVRLERRPPNRTDTNYWALKTTAGANGQTYWPMFLEENVIAIGWSDISVDPSDVTRAQLIEAIRNAYPNENAPTAANKIKDFVALKVDDIVIICRGYSSQPQHDVLVNGIARVAGPFYVEPDLGQQNNWRFKHAAVIQQLEIEVPRDKLAEALDRGSLMQTIHRLERSSYERLVRMLREFDVHVIV